MEFIRHFLNYVGARSIRCINGGLLAVELFYLLKRARADPTAPGRGYLAVLYTLTGYMRPMTGLGRMPAVPPPDVRTAFEHELGLGLPRKRLGLGLFALGKVARAVARVGLDSVDIDIVRCHTQLRLLRWPALNLPLTKDYLKRHRQLTEEMAMWASKTPEEMKTIITGVVNGGKIELQGLRPSLCKRMLP